MFKRIAAILLATPLFLLPATPARADSDELWYTAKLSTYPSSCTKTLTGTGVTVCWVANGDKFYVKDTSKDGLRSGAYFSVSYGSRYVEGWCVNTLGSGKTGLCDLAFTEKLSLFMMASTCDADTAPHACTDDDDWTTRALGWSQT